MNLRMLRQVFVFTRCLALLTGSALGIESAVAASASSRTTLPNILWIGLDQLRPDAIGCYGSSVCQTPNLDRLARQGVRFSNAYTTCCLCSPARASMLTGKFAFKHGMGTNCDLYHSLSPELLHPEMLLHPRLVSLGYRCGFVGKWHVGTKMGADAYGFEGLGPAGYGGIDKHPEFLKYIKNAGLSFGAVKHPVFGNPKNKTLLAGEWDGPVETTPAYFVAERSIRLLKKYAKQKGPFFLDCQFWGPHPPYLPSREFVGRTDRTAIKPWINLNDDLKGKPASVARFRAEFYRQLPKDWPAWREMIGLYYDYITMFDQQIGRILDQLDELGLADNTIVFIESDHGDMIGSHGLFDKGFMYQEAFRIPLIVRWPARCKKPAVSDELVYNMDIFPTILDALGQPDNTLDGRSFLEVLNGQAPRTSRDAIYLEFHGIRYLYSQRALVTRDGYKYIFNAGDFDEFYDLNRDPGELNNGIEAPEYRETVIRLRERLKRAAAETKDPIQDDIAKMFGDWENLSGQFEAAGMIHGQGKK
jgi:arylsulfatase A-like enzyme